MIKKKLVPAAAARDAPFEYKYAGTNNEMPQRTKTKRALLVEYDAAKECYDIICASDQEDPDKKLWKIIQETAKEISATVDREIIYFRNPEKGASDATPSRRELLARYEIIVECNRISRLYHSYLKRDSELLRLISSIGDRISDVIENEKTQGEQE